MDNVWLKLHKARKLSGFLNAMFKGEIAVEDLILQEMWQHPWYETDMWLNVEWYGEYEEYVGRITVGVRQVQV